MIEAFKTIKYLELVGYLSFINKRVKLDLSFQNADRGRKNGVCNFAPRYAILLIGYAILRARKLLVMEESAAEPDSAPSSARVTKMGRGWLNFNRGENMPAPTSAKDFRDAARAQAAETLLTWREIMGDPRAATAYRLEASKLLAAYGFGKPSAIMRIGIAAGENEEEQGSAAPDPATERYQRTLDAAKETAQRSMSGPAQTALSAPAQEVLPPIVDEKTLDAHRARTKQDMAAHMIGGAVAGAMLGMVKAKS